MQLVSNATASDISDRSPRVAILPIGSFEQHGAYLPLTTDTIVSCAIADRIAAQYNVLELSPITISCSHEHSRFPGTVSVSARTLHQIVVDVMASLEHSGIGKLVLISGHGGNHVLGNVVLEANVGAQPRMSLFPHRVDWQTARDAAGLTSTMHDDMHAGELETSILLQAAPEYVRDGNEKADHAAPDRPFILTVGVTDYTESGVIGYPSLGTSDKGEKILSSLTASFSSHLRILGIAS